MGMYRTFEVIIGVPVDVESWFRSYEALPDYGWCDHKEKFDEDTNYCPVCGEKKPEPRTYRELDLSKAPDYVTAEALQDEPGNYSRPGRLTHEKFGGLTLLSNTICEGNSSEEDVFFLGVHIARAMGSGGYDEFFGSLDGNELQNKIAEVKAKARDLGISDDPALAWYSWYG